jgi:glycosyltransferase EpsH
MKENHIKPLISVIVPVYNAESYLRNCIGSILEQDFNDFELILIDDGSKDDSLKIIQEYSKDKRLKYQSIKNAGVSNARNLGIKLSRGDYLMFVDADDWLEAEALKISFDFISKNKLEILFFSWYKSSKKEKFKVKTLEQNAEHIKQNDTNWLRHRCIGPFNKDLAKTIPLDIYNTPWAKLYKAELIKENDVFFKPRYEVGMEDVLFNIELFQNVKKIGYLNKYLYNYRIDSENSLTKVDVSQINTKLKNLINEIKNSQLPVQSSEVINNRIRLSLINITVSLTSKYRETSFKEKVSKIDKVLNDKFYHKSLYEDFSKASSSYKLFFTLCKFKMSFILTLILTTLNRIK